MHKPALTAADAPFRRARSRLSLSLSLSLSSSLSLSLFPRSEGDAHVIRNAGGRADDSAIRSLVISHKLLATNEWFVVHHTDCGMEFFTSEHMGELLSTSLATAAHNGKEFANVSSEGGAPDGKFISWLTINNGQVKAVAEDVHRIAHHPLVAPGLPLHGYVYDVKTGKLSHVLSVVTRA